ncbi:MAG: LysM peptidoglycan-binding domain-containing protein [Gemmatimonadales bacterium]
MRRTTICRSSRAVVAVVVALPLSAATLAAQDPTTAVQGQESHVVSQGETLWSISQRYFTDPLLWPEIYRRNTAIIEDPHWIYPGEVLNIGGIAMAPTDTTPTEPQGIAEADTVTAGPIDTTPVIEPPPPEPEGPGTIFDRQPTKQQQVQDVLRSYAHQAYRPVRRGEFYSAGFLTESEKLPWASVVGNTAEPAIQTLADPATASLFEEISILPPPQASYHVGDSLLLARVDREIDPWGNVVVPVGVARVTNIQQHQVLAQIIMQFGRIQGGRLALPLEPFRDPGNIRPAAVEQGLEGRLIELRDRHVLANAQQVLFIDKGRADGVAMGDVFEAYRPASREVGGRSEEVRVQMIVVHTREHTASALVIGVTNPAVPSGMPVRMIKKMPS